MSAAASAQPVAYGAGWAVKHPTLDPDNGCVKRKPTKRQIQNIREGTKAAMLLRRVQDRRISRIAPYGYRFSANGEAIEADEAEQAVIKYLKEEIGLHHSYHELARLLNEKGAKPRSGRRWYASTVRSIVLRMLRVTEEKARWHELLFRRSQVTCERVVPTQACLLSKSAT